KKGSAPFHRSSFEMRCTVPVPIPNDLATFKIPVHFASCFRTFFGLDDPRGRSPLVLDARRRKPPPASADIARKIGLSGTILPNLPTSPHKAESCGVATICISLRILRSDDLR